MKRVIVVGSGPAGCVAAAVLAERDREVEVTLLERGYPLPDGPMSACGTLFNGLARINGSQQSVVLGGGAAINYGVWATAPQDEWETMWGGHGGVRIDWASFQRQVAAPLVSRVAADRAVTRTAAEAAAALGICAKRFDPSIAGGGGALLNRYDANGEWITTGTLADVQRDRRNSPLSLVASNPRVRILVGQRARRIEQGEGGQWRVHTSDAVHVANQVVVCAGTIGTPELLLGSALPGGVSHRAGAQMHDHLRTRLLLFRGCRDGAPTPIARVTEPLVSGSDRQGRFHVEVASQSNLEGALNLGLLCTKPCCVPSTILGATPAWLTLSPTLSTGSFDPWCCCGPCAPMCNALRCVNMTAVVVGVRSDVPGRVDVAAGGAARVTLPGVSDLARRQAFDAARKIENATDACCVVGASEPFDTEWHFVGTAPYGVATDDRCQLKSENGQVYQGLYIGDLSLLHAMPTLNTQAPAAACGYFAAQCVVAPVVAPICAPMAR